eukprot:CAMPEP_0174349672 /NCGR_PEP_ID=MMETSP0811_2-20130205/6455_1 /TAXON_ID=73025 ORGANISM="Eutreptiella gymnastica-like, Strain CCMP1594" /NCGR_SAMPLE_ID=MMETSP0811_2 /ASSEMBLY_ACC=CAM_ASM_000667 /LENGTH=169 /DNA_ID=CAMNT_0015477231 /DNA_START=155 /DNA_END=662 /DNA_ORIENTATION=+
MWDSNPVLRCQAPCAVTAEPRGLVLVARGPSSLPLPAATPAAEQNRPLPAPPRPAAAAPPAAPMARAGGGRGGGRDDDLDRRALEERGCEAAEALASPGAVVHDHRGLDGPGLQSGCGCGSDWLDTRAPVHRAADLHREQLRQEARPRLHHRPVLRRVHRHPQHRALEA